MHSIEPVVFAPMRPSYICEEKGVRLGVRNGRCDIPRGVEIGKRVPIAPWPLLQIQYLPSICLSLSLPASLSLFDPSRRYCLYPCCDIAIKHIRWQRQYSPRYCRLDRSNALRPHIHAEKTLALLAREWSSRHLIVCEHNPAIGISMHVII